MSAFQRRLLMLSSSKEESEPILTADFSDLSLWEQNSMWSPNAPNTTTDYSGRCRNTTWFTVNPNNTYKVSIIGGNLSSNLGIRRYDANGSYLGLTQISKGTTTFTGTAGCGVFSLGTLDKYKTDVANGIKIKIESA